jgi:hypothetical protein
VLIAAKKQLQLGNITKSKDIELITGSVSLEGKKKMLVGAFYIAVSYRWERFASKFVSRM